jgi:DeoR/GlpR family transcriptional regulator of sugar metabolism
MGNEKAYPEERLIQIVKLVQENRTVNVDELAQIFNVTGATIRADLRALESRGVVSRTHGGAILRELVDSHLKRDRDPAYQNRLSRMEAEKEAIGAACAAYLKGEDCITLDDGTTTLCVARHLNRENAVTVITNGLSACNELAGHLNVNVICTGGTLVREDLAFNGRAAEEAVGKFHTSCAVLGASGFTPQQGLTAPDEQRAELKKRMIAGSIKTVIVADHSKLTRVSLVSVCEAGAIDALITDRGASDDILNGIRSCGVQAIIAE